ncbi:MAG: hypothetical protein LJE62_05340 [Silicimonas sp.]|jgi:hypothetical protein|nr:hypothetical protein [Silicimonas sp.]
MDITAELDAMRVDVQGCALVAYTDLSSQLVLSTSAAANPVQEEMNALSQAAHLALDGAIAEGAAVSWGGETPAELAFLMTGAEVRLFLRSPANSSEALIAVCAPDVDLERAVSEARATLARIGGQG